MKSFDSISQSWGRVAKAGFLISMAVLSTSCSKLATLRQNSDMVEVRLSFGAGDARRATPLDPSTKFSAIVARVSAGGGESIYFQDDLTVSVPTLFWAVANFNIVSFKAGEESFEPVGGQPCEWFEGCMFVGSSGKKLRLRVFDYFLEGNNAYINVSVMNPDIGDLPTTEPNGVPVALSFGLTNPTPLIATELVKLPNGLVGIQFACEKGSVLSGREDEEGCIQNDVLYRLSHSRFEVYEITTELAKALANVEEPDLLNVTPILSSWVRDSFRGMLPTFDVDSSPIELVALMGFYQFPKDTSVPLLLVLTTNESDSSSRYYSLRP